MNEFNSEHPDKDEAATLSPQEAKAAKGSRATLYIAYLALFFTAVGITVGYKHWVRIHDKAKVALKEIEDIRGQLANTADKDSIEALKQQVNNSSDEAEKKLSSSLLELDQIREQTTFSARSVKRQIEELTNQQSASKVHFNANTELQLAEVRFLLKSAQRRLELEYDKEQALKLMQAADEVLIELGSPELLTVREKLAADIATLQRFDLRDSADLSREITELNAAIKPLLEVDSEQHDGETVVLFTNADQQSISGKVKDYINRSVAIRKLNDSPRFALNNYDKMQLDHLLQLRLESLRMMVMQRHDVEYHQDIQNIRRMLEHYYSSEVAKPWLEKLQELAAINLTPELPDISSALDQLSNPTVADKP